MAKKEINVFSVSFLDILSGALASVIILFIIVPKVDIEDMEQLRALDEAEMMVTDLDSLIHMVSATVPDSEYVAIVEVSKKLQATIGSLKQETQTLQGQLASKSSENKQLRKELEQLKAQQKQLQKQLAKTQKTTKSTTPEPTTEQQKVEVDSTPGVADYSVGFNAPLTVRIDWEDSKNTVHLYMKPAEGGNFVYYNRKYRIAPFGKWMKMPGKFDKGPHEMIVQRDELVPGTYEIHAHLSRPRKEGKATITGFIATNPVDGTGIPEKVEFGEIELESGAPPYSNKSQGETLLGILTVTEEGIQWEQRK